MRCLRTPLAIRGILKRSAGRAHRNIAGRHLVASVLLLLLLQPQAHATDPSDEFFKDQAFQAAQYALSTSAGQAIALVGLRVAAADPELADLVAQHQQVAEQLRLRDRDRLDRLAKKAPEGMEQGKAAQEDTETLRQRLGALEQRLNDGFPGYLEMAHPRPLSIPQVQALLHDDEAFVLTLATPTVTYVWALTREASAWQRLGMGTDELAAAVRRLRAGLDPRAVVRGAERLGDAPQATGFDRRLAHRLYEGLLGPFDGLIGDKSSLLISTDGPLTSLPPSLLVVAPPEGEDRDLTALRHTDWLVRHHAVTLLPTVSSLSSLRRVAGRKSASQPFIGFGAPQLAGAAAGLRGVETIGALYRDGLGDVQAVRALSPLPATAGELRRMADSLGALPSSVVLGDAATETRLKQTDLEDTQVLAFATHGLLAGELSGLAEPALVLTPPEQPTAEDDGLLTASEAARLRLNSDWVVLSACNTAAPDGTPGAEGLSGLARAFLFAGARALLVSHWPVRDDAAATLTSDTFALLAKDPELGRAEAVRRARLALIESDTDPTLAHPASWAPFEVVGEGAR